MHANKLGRKLQATGGSGLKSQPQTPGHTSRQTPGHTSRQTPGHSARQTPGHGARQRHDHGKTSSVKRPGRLGKDSGSHRASLHVKRVLSGKISRRSINGYVSKGIRGVNQLRLGHRPKRNAIHRTWVWLNFWFVWYSKINSIDPVMHNQLTMQN